MAFIIYLLVGFVSGILGGMGMGGGTIMIPALTLFVGVEQHVAQTANLISFLPMAVFSLSVHKKQGLLSTDGITITVISALISSVLGGMFAINLPSSSLKKLFGAFLIVLAFVQVKGLTVKKSF